MQSQSLTPQLSFSFFLDLPLNCFGPQTYQLDYQRPRMSEVVRVEDDC
jgi:hypothetical protein